ncbi:MAG: hypothetical protein KDK00_12740 [Rhodobacteraceae bacterium]|nr:hypothetical protein [Paracoccaceae bacterium]
MAIVQTQSPPEAPLRHPDQVMRLERMGAAFPHRLSFMRTLLRRLNREGADVTRPVWEIDAEGYGRAVYSVPLGGDVYSLIAFSQPLDAEARSDRVIATAWDASFALFDGVPTPADLDRLQANVPKQEAGRYSAAELSLSRANRSVRFFEHVVARLASGQQPDAAMLREVGYLMRTTAVYGNGKLGFADRARIADRPAMRTSFHVEMLNVWLIRGFTHDLVDHIAKARNPAGAVVLSTTSRRSLGIGNSTGLGLAPFLVTHLTLLNNWMAVRETALARVRAVRQADTATIARVVGLIDRASRHLAQWQVADQVQMDRIIRLRAEWREVQELANTDWLAAPDPWERLIAHSARWSLEAQELLVALVLEPYGDLVDDLGDRLAAGPRPALDPGMKVADLRALVAAHYGWALAVDFSDAAQQHFFWYVSEAKLEPRLGRRHDEAGAERESPLDIARRVQALMGDLAAAEGGESLALFLMRHPEHRYVARRAQVMADHPYAEIRDNLLGANCRPIDMLRFKLAYFGASKFDPKSDLWTRINMYQGAPGFAEIGQADADDWWLPVLGDAP